MYLECVLKSSYYRFDYFDLRLNYLVCYLNNVICSQSGFDTVFGYFEYKQVTDIKPRAVSQFSLEELFTPVSL